MSYGADMLEVTEETFKMIKATTTGLTSGTGISGTDLGHLISLVPVVTPFRNSVARSKPPMGATFAYWRALQNVNNQQPNPGVGSDYGASIAVISEQDVYAPFVPLRTSGRVTEDAIDIAQGYEDALALETMYVLNQALIGEDVYGLNGQAYALSAIGSVSLSSAATGGSIAASTAVYVACAPRSGVNYYYGGAGPASSAANTTTSSVGSSHTVTATVTGVKGAAAYDWYVGTSGGQFYYTTTYVPTVVITSVPTAAQALPAGSVMPLLSSLTPGTDVNPWASPGVAGNGTPTSADTSFSATNSYNGLTASLLGDYGSGTTGLITPGGAGTPSGSYYASLSGNALTLSDQGIAEIDTLNAGIWNNALIAPTRYLVSARVGAEISAILFGSSAALVYLQPTDDNGRGNAVAGGAIARYINRSVPGSVATFEVQPHLPPGQLIAVTDRITYPGANITAPFDLRVQRDFSRFEYGANLVTGTAGGGPRQDFGITVRETFRNFAAVTQGIIQDIG